MMSLRLLAAVVVVLVLSGQASAKSLAVAIEPLAFELLAKTFDDARLKQVLGDHGRTLPLQERQAAALLVTLGAFEADDLRSMDEALVERATRFVEVLTAGHPALMGRFDDTALYDRIETAWQHESLLAEDQLIVELGDALDEGVITGYDLRAKGVYDNLPAGLTFIYSHSSLEHMRQLLVLLASESVDGWLSITPKVSAFLYRDDWGPASDRVKTLTSGLRVINGEEIAVLFEFDTRADLDRFHELITRFAKKDKKDEAGLIVDAWWQPFYYTDQPYKDFKQISLVVVSSDTHEATLTVVPERTPLVEKQFEDSRWEVRTDTVWVNPPFFRFLNGDYR